MKKWCLFLGLYFCLALTAGCAGRSTDSPQAVEPEPDTGTDTVVQIVDKPPWFLTCRIVDGAESGQLLLAEQGDTATSIYTLSMDSLTFEPQFIEPLRSGQLINVYYESFTEAWPMNFGGVSAIEILEVGFDDRCSLYLQVLEDLWEADSGLNNGVEVIGMDLSQTSLSPSEQAAVGWIFAGRHGAEVVDGTLNELVEQGWITATPLSISGSGTDLSEPKHYFYEWENGCHFSITEQPMEGTYSLVPVTFDAQKWRSSLGAYWFCDCTAVQSALGEWSDYSIGSEVIS